MLLNSLIFGGVLLLTFVVIFAVIRPTASERTIEGRIAKLRMRPTLLPFLPKMEPR
jgi:hypothetical protein